MHNNVVYQKTLIYNIYPRIMTKVNVSSTVVMSATVGGNVCDSRGKCPQQWGMSTTVEEIEYALRNVRLEIAIHKSA